MDYQNSPNPQQENQNDSLGIALGLIAIMIIMFFLSIQIEPMQQEERKKMEQLEKKYRELQNRVDEKRDTI